MPWNLSLHCWVLEAISFASSHFWSKQSHGVSLQTTHSKLANHLTSCRWWDRNPPPQAELGCANRSSSAFTAEQDTGWGGVGCQAASSPTQHKSIKRICGLGPTFIPKGRNVISFRASQWGWNEPELEDDTICEGTTGWALCWVFLVSVADRLECRNLPFLEATTLSSAML